MEAGQRQGSLSHLGRGRCAQAGTGEQSAQPVLWTVSRPGPSVLLTGPRPACGPGMQGRGLPQLCALAALSTLTPAALGLGWVSITGTAFAPRVSQELCVHP